MIDIGLKTEEASIILHIQVSLVHVITQLVLAYTFGLGSPEVRKTLFTMSSSKKTWTPNWFISNA